MSPGLPASGGPADSGSDLRLEVLVQEDVVAVELKAALVVYNHLLDTLEAVHKYVIDVLEQLSDPLSAVLGGEVPSNLLDGPLADLWGSQRITCSDTAKQNGGEG